MKDVRTDILFLEQVIHKLNHNIALIFVDEQL